MANRTLQIESIPGYDLGMSLDDLLLRLNKIRDSVPEPFRESIRVDYESGDYEGDLGKLTFAYSRPETPEETTARETESRQRIAERERMEREQFERLKRKFGQ